MRSSAGRYLLDMGMVALSARLLQPSTMVIASGANASSLRSE